MTSTAGQLFFRKVIRILNRGGAVRVDAYYLALCSIPNGAPVEERRRALSEILEEARRGGGRLILVNAEALGDLAVEVAGPNVELDFTTPYYGCQKN